MLDTGRIDDSGRVFEALAIEGRRRLVQRLMVEGLGQDLLIEIAADDRHLVDRRDGWDAQVA